jgi:hypothetical protein
MADISSAPPLVQRRRSSLPDRQGCAADQARLRSLARKRLWNVLLRRLRGEARGAEFDLGVPLTPHRWHRTDLENAFWEGIGGTIDGNSDNTEACDTCGKTLSYILTDYGVEQNSTTTERIR